ncbi:MAG: T9SS type A sorting domain-containing protein, partial [Bacteroidota bacterium]
IYSVRADGKVNSETVPGELFLTLPATPNNLVLNGETNDSFLVAWSSTDGVAQFEVDVSTDNFSTFLDGFESAQTTDFAIAVDNLQVGNYQVRVRAVNDAGASANSEVFEKSIVTSIDNVAVNSFLNLYPNPAKEELTIDLPEVLSGEVRMNVYDLSGASVGSSVISAIGKDQVKVSVSTLDNGVYLMVISGDQYLAQGRFVKK